MIDLDNVFDSQRVHGRGVDLLTACDFHLPAGRYALLSPSPANHRVLIDVLAGIRRPHSGHVHFQGSVSWPFGRRGFVRGRATGIDLIHLVADIHALDRHYAADLVGLMLSRPEALFEAVEHWPTYVRQEFGFALGLVPDFDIYVIDGSTPSEATRFARIWQALFEQRLVGKTLIMTSQRPQQILDYCAKALVHEHGTLRIDHDLEGSLDRYPVRMMADEPGVDDADNLTMLAGDDDGGDFLI